MRGKIKSHMGRDLVKNDLMICKSYQNESAYLVVRPEVDVDSRDL